MRKFVVLFFALTLVQCTKKTSLEYGLDIKETLRINILEEPPSLDWEKSEDAVSHMIQLNIMEGLVDINYRDKDLPPIPALATEWKISPDGRIWTFTIRKGVHWTDGVEFTAQQVLDGWERLLNPKTASPYAYIFNPIHNAEAYLKGQITNFSKVGAKINERGQIVVELDRPLSYFPYFLAMEASYPIRKDIIEKFADHWTDPKNIQTLGPYKLKIWDHDKAVVIERNDNYWGEKARTKYVLCRMIREYSTAINLFLDDRLDFQETMPYSQIPELKTKPGFRQAHLLGTYFYGLNVRKPPFDNALVRRAFAHAIDRKQITDLLDGGMKPLTSWLPPGISGFDPDVGAKFDVQLANKLLDSAGYKDRSRFPHTTIGVNTNENHQRIAENVQQQILKNLGLRVDISNEEWKVYLSRLKSDPPNIYRYGWFTDYPDPDSFMSLMLGGSEQNNTGWKNKAYDDLVNQAATELDKGKRQEIYLKAQKLLTEEEVPVIPIHTLVYSQLVSPRIKNFPLNPMERLQFKEVVIQ